jgi:hypothetical protein
MKWIKAQNGGTWRPLVKTAMNILVPQKARNLFFNLADCYILKIYFGPWSYYLVDLYAPLVICRFLRV